MGGELGGGVERRTQKAGMNDGWRTAMDQKSSLSPFVTMEGVGAGGSRLLSGTGKSGTTFLSSSPLCPEPSGYPIATPSKGPPSPAPSSS